MQLNYVDQNKKKSFNIPVHRYDKKKHDRITKISNKKISIAQYKNCDINSTKM